MEKNRKTKVDFGLLIFILVIMNLLSIYLMFIQQRFIDSFYEQSQTMNKILFSWIILLILNFVVKSSYVCYLNNTMSKIKKKLMQLLFRKRDENNFLNNGEQKYPASAIIKEYVDNYVDDYYKQILQLIATITLFVLSLVYIWIIEWKIAVIVVAFLAMGLYVNKFYGNKTSDLYIKNADNQSILQRFVENIMKNRYDIKLYKIETEILRVFQKNNLLNKQIYLRLKNKYSLYSMVNIVFYAIEKLSVMIFSVFCFQKSWISAGEMIIIIFLLPILCNPFSTLGTSLQSIKKTKKMETKILEILNNAKEYPKAVMKNDTMIFPPQMLFYPNSDFHLEIKELKLAAGGKYLLAGNNGAGKTTFISHVLRSIYGTELEERLGVVGQWDQLFGGSIYENICLDKKVSQKEIEQKLKEFDLKQQLSYMIEKGQKNISRGEAQRILILRQLIQNKNFLILDESLNGLDESMMLSILEYLLRLPITLLIISHQITQEQHQLFDEIILLKDGKMVTRGKDAIGHEKNSIK